MKPSKHSLFMGHGWGPCMREIDKSSGVFGEETDREVWWPEFHTGVYTELNRWTGPWEDIRVCLPPGKHGSGVDASGLPFFLY